MSAFALRARKMVTPLRVVENAVVVADRGKIVQAGTEETVRVPEGLRVTDLGDRILVPGLIDIHHHGAVGADASDGPAALRKIAAFLPSTGCTSWLPTVNTARAAADIARVMREGTGGASSLGVHMEGPFHEPKNIPGQEGLDAALRKPDIRLLNEIQEKAQGNVRVMTISLLLEGALDSIREMRRLGIVPAVAHTKADYRVFIEAVEAGLMHATHIYNGLLGFHHRAPGVVGGILTCDRVTGEIIGDGVHVDPVAINMVYRCKGAHKVALITDESYLAGMPDGVYRRSGVSLVKKGGAIRLEGYDERASLSLLASGFTLDHGLRLIVEKAGIPLADAVRMATLTPASIAGAASSKGSLEPGKDADLGVLDADLTVYAAYVGGREVFRRAGQG
jgi:N-acetylglucosamine-6-phosphate deacetylase